MLHQQLESKLTTPILPTDELDQKENLTLKSENFLKHLPKTDIHEGQISLTHGFIP